MAKSSIYMNGNEHNGAVKTIVSFGFTGTREGMTDIQKAIVAETLMKFGGTFHHGDCIGSDSEAHDIAHALGFRIVGHPPTNTELRAYKNCHELVEPKPYLIRNKEIVLASNVILATPKSMQEVGGTWSTINYTRKLIASGMQKQCHIILPNGNIGTVEFIPDSDLKRKYSRAKLDS